MARSYTDIKNQIAKRKNEEGQSLIELLIGVTVGAILIGSAAVLIVVTLKASAQNKYLQAASFLAQDLAEKATVYAERQWYCPPTATGCGIYNLQKDGTHYSLTGTPLTWQQTDETIPAIDNVNYTRYFTLLKVCRDVSGNIRKTVAEWTLCGGTQIEDPSSLQVTAVAAWTDQGGGSVKIVKFLTRHGNRVMVQTDWSGGDGAPGPFAAGANVNVFDAVNPADSIDCVTIPGSISILTAGGSPCP